MRLRRSGILVGLAALAVAVALHWLDPAPVAGLRLASFDAYQRLAPRAYAPAPVRVVDVDDAALARLGQWPWPRTRLAELVRRLSALGAAVIAFDMVFAEPDRTSPRQALPLWPDSPAVAALRAQLDALPDHDRLLAEAFAAAPVVVGMALTRRPQGEPPAPKHGLAFGGSDPLPFLTRYRGALRNLPLLEQAASGLGNLSLVPDRDGVVRRIPLLAALGETAYPALALEALRVAQGAGTLVARSNDAGGEIAFGQAGGLASLKVGDFTVPTTPSGELWVRYAEAAPQRTISAWRVLDEPAAALRPLIEGQIVLVGASATALGDLRATPLSGAEPGVLIQAQVVEQILFGDFLARPDWAEGAERLGLALVGGLLVWLLPRVGALWGAAVGLGALAAGLGGSWLAYAEAGLLLDPAYAGLAVVLVYLAQTTAHYLASERERTRVRDAFARYLSPAMVERLADQSAALRLGGEMRELTVMFCDIRGFTRLSEELTAEALTRVLNDFLTPMSAAVLERGGTIDKFMGDAIMAFWNAPLPEPEHARRACETALAMRARLAGLDAPAKARAAGGIRIGIGLNTGACCVGNMGSEQRFNYSALGDPVNLASRLEGLSKTYGVDIVVGEETRAQAPAFAFLELDRVRVKGRAQAVRAFALLGDETLARSAAFERLAEAHAAGLAAYRRQDWTAAHAAFAHASRCAPADLQGLYRLYRARIEHLQAEPPGPDWDAVFAAEAK